MVWRGSKGGDDSLCMGMMRSVGFCSVVFVLVVEKVLTPAVIRQISRHVSDLLASVNRSLRTGYWIFDLISFALVVGGSLILGWMPCHTGRQRLRPKSDRRCS